jgi:hypothetical protein
LALKSAGSVSVCRRAQATYLIIVNIVGWGGGESYSDEQQPQYRASGCVEAVHMQQNQQKTKCQKT